MSEVFTEVSEVIMCDVCEEDMTVTGEDETELEGYCTSCGSWCQVTRVERDWEPYEDDDAYADSQVLASAGWGTDEDYGCFGGDY